MHLEARPRAINQEAPHIEIIVVDNLHAVLAALQAFGRLIGAVASLLSRILLLVLLLRRSSFVGRCLSACQ